jgi:hypothetical protein
MPPAYATTAKSCPGESSPIAACSAINATGFLERYSEVTEPGHSAERTSDSRRRPERPGSRRDFRPCRYGVQRDILNMRRLPHGVRQRCDVTSVCADLPPGRRSHAPRGRCSALSVRARRAEAPAPGAPAVVGARSPVPTVAHGLPVPDHSKRRDTEPAGVFRMATRLLSDVTSEGADLPPFSGRRSHAPRAQCSP